MDGFSRKMRDKSARYLAWRRCENTATERIDRPAWTISGLSPQPFRESEKSEAAAEHGLRSALFGIEPLPSATLSFGPAGFWRGMFIFFKLQIV
mgnify:FL=1